MKKLPIYLALFLFLISSLAYAQRVGWQKPVLGTQINRRHQLAQGLVGAWIFIEGSGKIYDYSGYEKPATLTNGAFWAAGKAGHTTSFDGDNDYAVLGSIAADHPLALAGSAFSWIAWGRARAGDDFQRIFDKSDAGGCANGYCLYVQPDLRDVTYGPGQFGISIDGGSEYNSSKNLYAINEWWNIAVTGDANVFKLYFNGIIDTGANFQVGGPAVPPSAAANMRFGSWIHSAQREFTGELETIYIYNRILSASEIEWLYREPYAMFAQPSVARRFTPGAAPAAPVKIPPKLMIMGRLLKNLGIKE